MPSELGMTESSNALPLRDFVRAGDNRPTWEDWEAKVKKEYPIKFFLIEKAWPWIRRQYNKFIVDTIYWLKCHTLSKYKHHLIDIRESKTDNLQAYRYGWIDCDSKITLALFAILNDFVENEMPNSYCPSEEEVQANPSSLSQRNNYLEVKAIHYWWNVERKRQQKKHTELLETWYSARKNKDPAVHQLWSDLQKLEESNKEKETEMLVRIIKVRESLWT